MDNLLKFDNFSFAIKNKVSEKITIFQQNYKTLFHNQYKQVL